jgi:hypothetical protein
MANLPWWTSTFGHVEQVPWDTFIAQTFQSLPVLQSLPNPSDLEKVLARVIGEFGPAPPEFVTREVLTDGIGLYGARFPTEIHTRACHWFPRQLA